MTRQVWPAGARSVGLAVALAAAAGVGGCGPSPVPVSGAVTYKGKPLTGGTVTLVGSDGGVAVGSIGPDGRYTVPQVTTGRAKIGVTYPNPNPTAGRAAEAKAAGRGGIGRSGTPGGDPAAPPSPATTEWVEIPAKYADPNTSGLTGEVKAGQPLDIRLE